MAIQLTHSLEAPGFLQISFRNPRNSSNNCSLGISYCPFRSMEFPSPPCSVPPGCFPVQIASQFLLCSGFLLSQPIGSTNNRMLEGGEGKRSGGLFLLLPFWGSPWVSSTPQYSFVRWAQLCTPPSVRILARLFPFTASLPRSGKSPG